jgi:lysophospholipase
MANDNHWEGKASWQDRRALPAEAQVTRWQAADGWALRIMEWPQRNSRGRGSLVFANGRGDFIEKYIEPLAYWHARGWNILAFDWRGQGGSAGTIRRGHLDSFDPLVADGAALLEYWLARYPEPHVAVAHSMGGHLLLRILAEHSVPIAATVLVAPMIRINARPIPHNAGRLISRLLANVGLRRVPAWEQNERPSLPGASRQAYLTSCPHRYADELRWKAQQPAYNLGPPSWGWLDAAYRSIDGLTLARLKRIEGPILMLGTDRDRLVSPTAIRKAAEALPGAELHMYPKAGHELLRESDPVRLDALARIDRFFDAHAPA